MVTQHFYLLISRIASSTQHLHTATMVQAPRSKPTILWVNGSFSPASFYVTMAGHVQSQGYEIIVETLPSSARAPPEMPATMTEDAAFFHDVAEKLADQGKDIVLVMHSYGGIVGTECSKHLSKPEREEVGKPGGIVRLVYFTCVLPEVGSSLADLNPVGLPPWIIIRDDVGHTSRPELFPSCRQWSWAKCSYCHF